MWICSAWVSFSLTELIKKTILLPVAYPEIYKLMDSNSRTSNGRWLPLMNNNSVISQVTHFALCHICNSAVTDAFLTIDSKKAAGEDSLEHVKFAQSI